MKTKRLLRDVRERLAADRAWEPLLRSSHERLVGLLKIEQALRAQSTLGGVDMRTRTLDEPALSYPFGKCAHVEPGAAAVLQFESRGSDGLEIVSLRAWGGVVITSITAGRTVLLIQAAPQVREARFAETLEWIPGDIITVEIHRPKPSGVRWSQ